MNDYEVIDEVIIEDIDNSKTRSDGKTKDSLIILSDKSDILAYEIGGVTDWNHLDGLVVYVKNGLIKSIDFDGGTVIYDIKEVIEEYYELI